MIMEIRDRELPVISTKMWLGPLKRSAQKYDNVIDFIISMQKEQELFM